MKLDPGFINHWKTELLMERLGSDAVVAILRLWGNAQIRRQFDGLELNPRRLAMETKWKGDAGALFDTLTDPDAPWLDLDPDGTYSIHGFGHHQKQVVALWENGNKGGRPKKEKSTHPHPLALALPLTPLGFEMEPNGFETKPNGFENKPNGFGEGASERAPIEFPPDLADRHPTDTAGQMTALADRVRSLRPEWKKMALTYAEMRSLTECAAALEALDDADWANIRGYLAAKLPEGAGGWQPRSRAKFLDSAPDVYSHATQWAAKNKPASNHPRTGGWR